MVLPTAAALSMAGRVTAKVAVRAQPLPIDRAESAHIPTKVR
jgi:hypothetical protein